MLKNIIFDVGGVLLQYRWKEMLMNYGLSEPEALRIGREMLDDPIWKKLDLGNLTDQMAADEYRKLYPADGDVIEWFLTHSEYMHVPRPEIWSEVHELKNKGYHIYLLSNYPESFFRKHTQYADFMSELDGMVVSYQIHIVKPDVRIYEYLCKMYHVNPEESLFFDDRPENIETAKNYGMQGIVVTSREQLLVEMKKLLKMEGSL